MALNIKHALVLVLMAAWLLPTGALAAPSTGPGTGGTVEADHIDAITEIAAALKTGADGMLVTGTAGATSDCAQWNVDGDLVTAGAACGVAILPVADTTSIAEGSVDATKEVRFEVDGLTTGTVRVITMPDANVDLGSLLPLGGGTMSGNITMGGNDLLGIGSVDLAAPAGTGVSTSTWKEGVTHGVQTLVISGPTAGFAANRTCTLEDDNTPYDSCVTPGSVGADSIGTSELDDGADTPLSGEYLRVDTVDQAGIEYRTTAQVLADIGGQATVTAARSLTFTGASLAVDEELYRDECNITFETATTADDVMCGKATGALTLVSLDCTATGGTTPSAQIVTVVECTNAGATCVSSGGTVTVSALTTNVADTTFTDAAIDDGDWWGIETTSLTTAADYLHCQVEFTRND